MLSSSRAPNRHFWLFLLLVLEWNMCACRIHGLTVTHPLLHYYQTPAKGMQQRRNVGKTRARTARSMSTELVPNSPNDELMTMSSGLGENGTSSPLTPMNMESKMTSANQSLMRLPSLQILENPSLKGGRFLVLLAACIYGTNFSIVKILDDTMPLSISATLRFGLAAACVAAMVMGSEKDDVEPRVCKERALAFYAGVEIGLWYCIGYIAQGKD